MDGKIKKGGYKGGRGYNGWHKTWDNKNVYLRSRLEYIYAKYLDMNKIPYTLEDKIFIIDDKSYKPDFFINLNGKIKVVEIKDSKIEKEEYLENFKSFFEGKDVEYEVLSFRDLKRIEKANNINTNVWIEKCVSENPGVDMRGNKNPHYGAKHSEAQKKLIGLKTKERFATIESRIAHSEKIKKSMDDNVRQKISQKRQSFSRKEYPEINKKCVVCEDVFIVRKNTKKENRQTCSRKCEFILNRGKHSFAKGESLSHRYPIKLVKQGLIIFNSYEDIRRENWDSIVDRAKTEGLVSKNLGISVESIEKFFKSFNEYKEIVNESKNKKDN